MDLATFKEKLFNEDLKSLPTPQKLQECLGQKYQDIEFLGTYKLNDSHIAIYFKHKLWFKLAIFKGEEWIETRVSSLKNKLPDETMAQLLKNLKKGLTIIRLESVIPMGDVFYFYVIAKISGKKFVLHVSREGEILEKTKFLEYRIKLDDDDDDDDDDNVNDEDDIEDEDELVETVEMVVEEEDID